MNLLQVTPAGHDATSFYRAVGVFGHLQKIMPDLWISTFNQRDFQGSWPELIFYDVIFMQRPVTPDAKKVILQAKEMGKKVWIDYDDDYQDIPPENPVFRMYKGEKVKKNIIEICKLADVITVTTKKLVKNFGKYNANVRHIPNAFNDYIFKPEPKKYTDVVFWRGSDSHQDDMLPFVPEQKRLIRKYEKIKWAFMGHYPRRLHHDKIHHIESVETIKYFKYVQQLAPKCVHVPLLDKNFNHCKSNIAAIEGALAGSVIVAPAWDEWNIPGVMLYNSPEEYGQNIEAIIRGEVDIKKLNTLTWNYISDNLLLSKVNKQRVDIINELLNHD